MPDSTPQEVIPGRTWPGRVMQALYDDRDARPVSPGDSRVGYADAVRQGRQVAVAVAHPGGGLCRAPGRHPLDG